MAFAMKEETTAFVQSIQRDLNCLSDPDRSTRRRALEKLHKRLLQGDAVAPPPSLYLLQASWDDIILQMVLKVLTDSVEKCRELAVNLIIRVCEHVCQVEQTAKLVVPVIAQRMGRLPVVEDSEEIRLKYLHLLNVLVDKSSIDILHSLSEPLCQVLHTSLADPYHEIKKATSGVIVLAAGRSEKVFIGKSGSLLMALLANISHTHSRVRFVVLQAVDAIMLCEVPAGFVEECLVPGVKALAFDRARGVRELFFESVAGWLGYRKGVGKKIQPCIKQGRDPRVHIPQLLPLLLLGISDESPDIAASSASFLEGVGEIYKMFSDSQHVAPYMEEDTEYCEEIQINLASFNGLGTASEESSGVHVAAGVDGIRDNATKGCHLMIQDFFMQLVRPLLKDLHDWTVGTRAGAARLLHTLLVFAKGHAANHLDILISALCSAVGDDDLAVASHVIEAAHVLGCNVYPSDWVPLMFDQTFTTTATPFQLANGLVILSALLHGTPIHAMKAESVLKISQGLYCLNLGFSDQSPIKRQLVAVLTNLIQVSGQQIQVSSFEILILLFQLQSSEADVECKQSAYELVDTLARNIGLTSRYELYGKHLENLGVVVTAGYENWSGNSAEWRLFQVFLRTAGRVIGPYLQRLLQLFTSCVHGERDPALRISFLQLLDELFEVPELATWWSPHGSEVVGNILIPCGIWQIGKVGAAVRHAAMVALGTFLRQDLCNQVQLVSLMQSQQLLAVITSCLEEDYYVDTRRAACHVMENTLRIIGDLINDEQRNEISKVLQKRLDDSSDFVRLAILPAISCFFQTLPSTYNDSAVKNFLSSLVIHMDDPNIEIREAVYKVATVCATRKPAIVEEVVTGICCNHQMTEYRESLLAQAAHIRKYGCNLSDASKA